MRLPTGAIAISVSAAASAITTVFEGTPCAPIAPRTMCRTVEIFTKAVTDMKAKGKSETTASATTSASGRLKRSAVSPSAACARAGRRSSGSSQASLRTRLLLARCAAFRAGEDLAAGDGGLGALARLDEAIGPELAELGEPCLRRAHDVDVLADTNEIDGSPRIEGQPAHELERSRRPADAPLSRPVQNEDGQGQHGDQGDEGLD